MRHLLLPIVRVTVVVSQVSGYASGQVQLSNAPQTAAHSSNNWIAPRTQDGQPDLQGIWTNATLTPLQRPVELGDKQFFTEEEAAKYERQRAEQTNVDRLNGSGAADLARRAYNEAWFERGSHIVKSRRTSLIVDPPDGRVPPMTAEARKKFDEVHAKANQSLPGGPEDLSLSVRCILFPNVGPPLLPTAYNNNYQIQQTPGQIMVLAEMAHVARVIPLDARPHLGPRIRQWKGDSRGRWDGDTLVVDTTNLAFNNASRFGIALDGMTDENLHIVERFTRTDPTTILYRATINDPTVYTKPWTVEISMTKAEGPIFEYACHEGNYAMSGVLSAARAEEKKSAEAAAKAHQNSQP
jgi:hypothetical protein